MNENKRKTTVQSPVYRSALRRLLAILSLCFLTTSSAWGDFQTGKDAYDRGDYATALKEFRPLAAQGDATAQCYLGLMYDKGYGVRSSNEKAVVWYRRAAEQGNTWAQTQLGYMYLNGFGVREDYVTSYMWSLLAEAGGDKKYAPQNRKFLSKRMTSAQITEARRRADAWKRRWEQPSPKTKPELISKPSKSSEGRDYQTDATATLRDAFDQTVAQIKVLEAELEQKRRLVEQKIAEEQKTNPLNAPKDQFESDADYAARKSQLESILFQHRSQLQKRYLEDIQNRVANLYRKTFQTSDITVTLGAYDANSERFPITFEAKLNEKVQRFKRYLRVNKDEARSLYNNWNQVTKTGYVSIDPGYRRGLARVKLEYPPIWRQGVTYSFYEVYHLGKDISLGEDISAVAFSPDGKYLAIGRDSDQYILELSSGNKVWQIDLRFCETIAFSPDGKYLAIGRDSDFSKGPYILELSSGNIFELSGVRSWKVSNSRNFVAFSPDGKYLGVYGGNDVIVIWDVIRGKSVWYMDKYYSFTFSPDGKYLAAGDVISKVTLWHEPLLNKRDMIRLSPWGRRTEEESSEIRQMNLDGITRFSLGRVPAVAFSPDGKYLAAGQYGYVSFWDVIRGTMIRKMQSESRAIAFSPDGQFLATGGGQAITFWRIGTNITTKTELKKEKTIRTSGIVQHLAWSPNGHLISDSKKIYRTLLPPETLEIEKPTPSYPPALAAAVRFSEASGNNFLDANEKGVITVTAKNSGRGYAAGVQVAITPPRIDGLSYANATIGDIPPGESRSVEIPIEASIHSRNATHTLTLRFSEKNAFPPDPLQLTFSTRAYIKPKLVVVDVGVDEPSGNGMIEPAEVVILTVRVQNQGAGNAKAVQAKVSTGNDVFITGASKTAYNLGELKAGDYKDFSFSVYTNKTATDIPVFVDFAEATGLVDVQDYRLPISLNERVKRIRTVVVEGQEGPARRVVQATGLSIDIEQNIPSAAGSNPDAVAVVIGIADYQKATDVQYARRDAQFVREYLIKTFGYDPLNILPRDPDELMTAGTLKTLIRKRLSAFVKKGKSDVFIYYSGHGAPSTNTNEGFLVPSDCDPNYINADNAYRLQDFYADLSKVEGRSLTVVLDACFSGMTGDGKMLIQNISPIVLPALDQPSHPLMSHSQAIVLTSTSNDRVSNWYPAKQHSLFTYFFLKGLQGAADSNTDDRITVSELEAYLLNEDEGVRYWSNRLFGRPQTPQIEARDKEMAIVEFKR